MYCRSKNMYKRGFTLIEVLVVIAIIALLMSIIIPAISKAKDHARRISCLNNMRQAGIGVYMYAQSNERRIMPLYAVDSGTIPASPALPAPYYSYMVYHRNQAVSGVYKPFHLALLYSEGYIATPEIFYCPAQPRSTAEYVLPYYYDFYIGQGNSSDYFSSDDMGGYEWGTHIPADKRSANSRVVRTSFNYWTYGQSKIETIGGYKALIFDNIQDWRVVPHRKGRGSKSEPQGLSVLYADGHAAFCNDSGLFIDDMMGNGPWNKAGSVNAGSMNIGQGPGNSLNWFEEILRRLQAR